MEWKNEKLLPAGFPELAYEITPREVADRLRVVALARRPGEGRKLACVEGVGGVFLLHIYPHAVIASAMTKAHLFGVPATAVWVEFLWVYLHEVGHVVAWLDGRDPGGDERYQYDPGYRDWVEGMADACAFEAMGRVARHPYLGQPRPGRLGNYPGKALLEAARKVFRWKRAGGVPGEDLPGRVYAEAVAGARAARCGGQFTVGAAARALGEKPRRLERECRALGLGRECVDRAGRRHLFLTWQEFDLLAARRGKKWWP